MSDPERRKYYDRTGRLERTVEEDFLDGFGRQAEATLRPTGGGGTDASGDDSTALQQRFTALQEQSHNQSFEARGPRGIFASTRRRGYSVDESRRRRGRRRGYSVDESRPATRLFNRRIAAGDAADEVALPRRLVTE